MDASFVVVRADNPARLPLGTRLAEVRRFESWQHQGCIPSIRDLVVELRVLTGVRAGEVLTEVLESAFEDDPPWSCLSPTWFVSLSGERT